MLCGIFTHKSQILKKFLQLLNLQHGISTKMIISEINQHQDDASICYIVNRYCIQLRLEYLFIDYIKMMNEAENQIR